MISVNEAKNIIENTVTPLPSKRLPLKSAAGCVLAQEVYAIADIPNFRQSSMDGYAIIYEEGRSDYSLAGEMAAGATAQMNIERGAAIRIFTGAPLPLGADTVVMQEKVEFDNGRIVLRDAGLRRFQNVREQGSEIKRADLGMSSGTILSPAAIGFLGTIGIAEVSVIPPPKVCLILTGNELQDPGKTLEFGQVYEANSVMLTAAMQQYGVTELKVIRAPDDLEYLQQLLNTSLQEADLVLLTGGVSVGDYDFVVAAARNAGVKQAFHRIKQKPGKPLYFGLKYQKVVFGLPGNPSSVLTCFYEYVLPAIGKMMGKKLRLQTSTAKLTKSYVKFPGLTHFLKGHVVQGIVMPLHAQESYRLHSFAAANCLIVLEEEKGSYAADASVEIHLLPDL